MKKLVLRRLFPGMPASSPASPRDQRPLTLEAHRTVRDAAICKVPPGDRRRRQRHDTRDVSTAKQAGLLLFFVAAVNARSDTKATLPEARL